MYLLNRIVDRESTKLAHFKSILNDVIVIRNIRYYPDTNQAHLLDVYKPKNTEQRYPAIIYVHGGDFATGDKESAKHFCASIAQLGYVVFAIEYRMVPDVRVYEQLRDVSYAMNFIKENGHVFGGDRCNTYMVGDTAGAYLVAYSLAMQNNRGLARAANVRPSTLRINAAGFISGILYTTRLSPISLIMSRAIYGKHFKKRAISKYTNPESICKDLPPCWLVSSKNDSSRRLTKKFANALVARGIENSLVLFNGDDKALGKSFPVRHPEYAESARAIWAMRDFFDSHRSLMSVEVM